MSGGKHASAGNGHGDAAAMDHTAGAPSRFAVAGHPIHPVLVPFPIALLISAFGGELPYRHLIGVSGHGDDGHAEGAEGKHGMKGMEGMDHGKSGEAGAPAGAAGGGHGGMAMGGAAVDPAHAVTGPQLAAVTGLTILALGAAVLWSVGSANLTLSAHTVGGAVMPPGMMGRRDLSAEAMREMSAIDLRDVRYRAPADATGDRPLQPRLENGVKVFDLETSVIQWNILPYARVAAYAYNGQVPGPRIRVTEGDRVRVNVRNSLPESTTIHWHGLILPNAMDGAANITQPPIPPGGRFVYEFTIRQAGTFFYHSHDNGDRQQALGLYGAFIADPRAPAVPAAYDKEIVVQLQEWTFKEGYTYPAMPMEGALPNFFTINGKAYPSTESVELRVGERLLIRFIGSSGAFIHPMHVHGGPFRIVATDGQPVPQAAQLEKDTVNVAPGERYDVIWEAREPGRWLLHCHIPHHMTNDQREEQGGGGLMLIINVRG